MALDFVLNGHRYTNDPAVVVAAGVPPEYQFIGYNATLALQSYANDITAVGGGSLDDIAALVAAAAASAASAISAPGTSATSTTSLTVGYGAKALTVQAGKVIVKGMFVSMASAAGPKDAWMHGIVSSYVPGTGALIMESTALNGLDAVAADWVISISAPGGAQLGYNKYTGQQYYAAGMLEQAVPMGAGAEVDLRLGNIFTKTATGALALTVTGIPAGAAASFVFKLTNGGAFAFTPPAGALWRDGVIPSLSVAGLDTLAFMRDSASAPWEIYVMGTNMRVAA